MKQIHEPDYFDYKFDEWMEKHSMGGAIFALLSPIIMILIACSLPFLVVSSMLYLMFKQITKPFQNKRNYN